MSQKSLRQLIDQHDRLVDAVTQNSMLERVLNLLANLHVEGGDTTTNLSVYLGSHRPYDKVAVGVAASVVREVVREALPALVSDALVRARQRYSDAENGKKTELAVVKQQIREQLELAEDQPAFLRKIMD